MHNLQDKFERCDPRFFSYLGKVLERLPPDVKKDILDNERFQLLADEAFHEAFGEEYDKAFIKGLGKGPGKGKGIITGSPDKEQSDEDVDNSVKTTERTSKSSRDNSFDEFWSLLPSNKEINRSKCKKKWNSLSRQNRISILIDIPKRLKILSQAKKEKWFVPDLPHPYTYLNGERWKDAYTERPADWRPKGNPDQQTLSGGIYPDLTELVK